MRKKASGARARAADERSLFRVGPRVVLGLTLGFLLVGGAGGWAATAQLTGAVVAPGSVTVDQNLKSIQHRDGGIVSSIAVREGDFVRAGQVLIQLEDAQTKAELSIIRSQLIELSARKARLLAERDGLDAIENPPGLGASPEAAVITGKRDPPVQGQLHQPRKPQAAAGAWHQTDRRGDRRPRGAARVEGQGDRPRRDRARQDQEPPRQEADRGRARL